MHQATHFKRLMPPWVILIFTRNGFALNILLMKFDGKKTLNVLHCEIKLSSKKTIDSETLYICLFSLITKIRGRCATIPLLLNMFS